MIGLGAYNAVNFDGGGSAAFIWSPGNSPYQPQESELLLRMMSNAQMPVGIPNDTLLQFEVNRRDPTTGYDLCAQTPCRKVYASVALAFTPPSPAVERR